MERSSRLTDRELDDLLSGKTPSGDPELEDVAAFFRDVRGSFDEDPSEETTTSHVAAMIAAAEQLAEGDATATFDSAQGPGRSPRWTFRRNRVQPHPLSSTRLKLLIVTSALLLLGAFSGVAAAGGLPDPVQGKVADIAGNLGVSLPGKDEGNADQPDAGNVDQPEQGNADQPNQGQGDQPDQGNKDEPDQGNKDDGALGNADQPDAGNADQPDAGNADQPDQGNKDEPDQGNKDEPDHGNTNRAAEHESDQPDQGNSDQGDQGN